MDLGVGNGGLAGIVGKGCQTSCLHYGVFSDWMLCEMVRIPGDSLYWAGNAKRWRRNGRVPVGPSEQTAWQRISATVAHLFTTLHGSRRRDIWKSWTGTFPLAPSCYQKMCRAYCATCPIYFIGKVFFSAHRYFGPLFLDIRAPHWLQPLQPAGIVRTRLAHFGPLDFSVLLVRISPRRMLMKYLCFILAAFSSSVALAADMPEAKSVTQPAQVQSLHRHPTLLAMLRRSTLSVAMWDCGPSGSTRP